MDNNKSDFGVTITELEDKVGTFKANKDPELYEEVAQKAKDIKQRIDEANEYAKMINNRENLVELEDVTDYQSVP
jgi:hypothetical protein